MSDYLFVYGTLLPGRAPAALAAIVDALAVVDSGTIAGRMYDLGSYPGVVPGDSAGELVRGVVLCIADPAATWPVLDRYEGYNPSDPQGSLFVRLRGCVQLAHGGTLEAWVYWYHGTLAGAVRLPHGDWAAR
jgi:gamma-glutamylcyclotransferase (GGCT)/AIG2-like uncharacterized protein YtfP